MGEHLRGTVLGFPSRLRRSQQILVFAAAAAYVVGVGLVLGCRRAIQSHAAAAAIDAAIC